MELADLPAGQNYCPSCNGRGAHLECSDQLCHRAGWCRHGREPECGVCQGSGRVDEATFNAYWGRQFERHERGQITPTGTAFLVIAGGFLLGFAVLISMGVIP